MTWRSLSRLTRNIEAPVLLESFFVAAVASFLGIRWFLAATGYPRLGSNGVHIAHMLWGGLLMLAALMLLLAFLDRAIQQAAAVIAGLGFGTFIDEIGKFVTADNDYFYRPAVALIYGLFVISFLVARTLVGQRRPSQGEALANVLAFLASLPAAGIEPDDRARLERLLDGADPTAARTRLARQYLAAVPNAAAHETWVETAYRRLADGYDEVMANPWAERALVVGVIVYAALAVMGVTLLAATTPSGAGGAPATVATPAQIGSTIVGAVLVGRGILSLDDSRMAAYHWFVRGILVWILVTQVFVFYTSQLAGLGGLVVDLIAYGSLRFALAREMAAGAAGGR